MIKGNSPEIKVDMTFFETFSDCFLQHSDLKSAIKNVGHHVHLGDRIGSSYPLNPCNCSYPKRKPLGSDCARARALANNARSYTHSSSDAQCNTKESP